jgi:aryl-alcohol dehydrogenase-like predicted oxidoreductase
MFETAERFSAFAKENGFDPVSLAVAWVASHPAVTAPIIGARNIRQLKPSIESVKIVMTDELRQEISSLSPEPSPATDRNEEGADFNYEVRK